MYRNSFERMYLSCPSADVDDARKAIKDYIEDNPRVDTFKDDFEIAPWTPNLSKSRP